jgi:hypothetical protein
MAEPQYIFLAFINGNQPGFDNIINMIIEDRTDFFVNMD